MKKRFTNFFVLLSFFSIQLHAQTILSNNQQLEAAYRLAVNTVKFNTHDSILAAGADYGGEWVRDISINIWNGVSFFSPEVAKKSLWSVTVDNRQKAGHQYWDRILWVHGAYNYFLVSQDNAFLKAAYTCGLNTMNELEATAFDADYGMFTGPSVFNDGIAGYDEPIYDPVKAGDGYVLNHRADRIKCLSTNCAYYMAYQDLNQMHRLLNNGKNNALFLEKAAKLRVAIRKNLYDSPNDKLNYLVDQNGKVHAFQEALGISYAIRGGVVTKEEGLRITQKCVKAKFGIPSISPSFSRFSDEKPGRHNRTIWPFVNASYAIAALETGNIHDFDFEFFNLMSLALDKDKGNTNFWEVYHPNTGHVDGGWQAGGPFVSCSNQTWSATGFLSMVYFGIAGLHVCPEKVSIAPYLPKGVNNLELNGLQIGQMVLNLKISGQGNQIKEFKVNGEAKSVFELNTNLKGTQVVEIKLG